MWCLLFALALDSTALRIPVGPAESLAVSVSGTGTPVVIVTGLFGTMWGFRHVREALVASGYRVVTIEPLGVGGSSRPTDADYSLGAQTDRVAAVLDSLAMGPALLVGHALGVSITLRLALHRPDLVRGVLGVDGGAAEAASTPGLRRAMRFAPILRLVAAREVVARQVRNGMEGASADRAWITGEALEAYTADAARDPRRMIDVLAATARSREFESLQGRLGEIRVPVVLVLGGAPHDGAVPAPELSLIARTIPQVRLDTVPAAGHFLQEERPDAVVAAVRAMLTRLDSNLTGPRQVAAPSNVRG